MKLIKINQDHYVIVDDSEVKEGDWYYQHNPYGSVIDRCDDKSPLVAKSARYIWENKGKKITHSTEPIECNKLWTPLDGKQWLCNTIPCCGKILNPEIKPISLIEVKKLLGEVDVEKKALELYELLNKEYFSTGQKAQLPQTNKERQAICDGFILGYNQCLEDNKEKKYTKGDLRDAFNAGNNYATKPHPQNKEFEMAYIQSLQPKTEWEVTFENGKLKLI